MSEDKSCDISDDDIVYLGNENAIEVDYELYFHEAEPAFVKNLPENAGISRKDLFILDSDSSDHSDIEVSDNRKPLFGTHEQGNQGKPDGQHNLYLKVNKHLSIIRAPSSQVSDNRISLFGTHEQGNQEKLDRQHSLGLKLNKHLGILRGPGSQIPDLKKWLSDSLGWKKKQKPKKKTSLEVLLSLKQNEHLSIVLPAPYQNTDPGNNGIRPEMAKFKIKSEVDFISSEEETIHSYDAAGVDFSGDGETFDSFDAADSPESPPAFEGFEDNINIHINKKRSRLQAVLKQLLDEIKPLTEKYFSIEDLVCEKSKKPFKRKLIKYRRVADVKKLKKKKINTFKCNHCGISFATGRERRMHRYTQCNKIVSNSSYSVFQCSFCDFKAENIIIMSQHNILHSQKSCYKCIMCYATFSDYFTYSEHLADHKKIELKFYTCSMCPFKCRTKSVLEKHRKYIHSVFQCNLCEYNGSNRIKWVDHMKLKHLKECLKCSWCEYVTYQKLFMENHKRKHKNDLNI